MFDGLKRIYFDEAVKLLADTVLTSDKLKVAISGLPGSGKSELIKKLIESVPLRSAVFIDDQLIYGWVRPGWNSFPSISWWKGNNCTGFSFDTNELMEMGFTDSKVIVSTYTVTHMFPDVDYLFHIACTEQTRHKNLKKRGIGHFNAYHARDTMDLNPNFKYKVGYVVVNDIDDTDINLKYIYNTNDIKLIDVPPEIKEKYSAMKQRLKDINKKGNV